MEEKMESHMETVDFVGLRSSWDEEWRVDA